MDNRFKDIDIEGERPLFEAAVKTTDHFGNLNIDFSRHPVTRGYAGYVNPHAESAFMGWMLARHAAGVVLRRAA